MGQLPVGPRLNKPASNFNNPVDRGRRSEGGNRSNTHVEANTETSRDRGSIPRVSTESPLNYHARQYGRRPLWPGGILNNDIQRLSIESSRVRLSRGLIGMPRPARYGGMNETLRQPMP